MKHTIALSTFIALLVAVVAGQVRAADGKPDEEGFIRDWLMLAPIPLGDSIMGAEEIEKKQIADEGALKPKEGDKQKVLDKEVAWKAVKAKDYYVDFNELRNAADEDVLGYLVAYVVAEKEMPDLTMLVSSNDQAMIFVNGKEVYKFTEGRTIDKDSDKVEKVSLKKGVNTIVFKVINEKNNWQACLRFKDKGDKPVTDLVVKTAP